MRRNQIITVLLAILATLFVSCTKESSSYRFDENEMHFNAFMDQLTKVTGNAFDVNDTIGVYVGEYIDAKKPQFEYSGNYATNIPTVFTGSYWASNPKIYWSEGGKYDIVAYYPKGTAQIPDNWEFEIMSDQSNEGYERSDFLWAKTSGVTKTDVVNLRFKHIMSRIVVTIEKGEEYEGDLPKNAEVYIHSTNPEAMIDLATGKITRKSSFRTETIKAKKTGDYEFTAIVVPQLVSLPVPLVEIVADGVSFLTQSNFNFKSGYSHNAKVTFDSNPEKIKIDIGGGSIEGWH